MAAPTSKRSFCTSRGDRGPSWSRCRDGPRVFRRSGLGDAAALSLSAAQLVAAHPGADLLADLADADLGFHEPVSLPQQQLCLSPLACCSLRSCCGTCCSAVSSA